MVIGMFSIEKTGCGKNWLCHRWLLATLIKFLPALPTTIGRGFYSEQGDLRPILNFVPRGKL
jgi:hypothetical protein